MRYLFAGLLFLLPSALWAACNGIDLRPTLDSAQKQEIRHRLEGVPFLSGNYWTATRGTRTIHVVGTIHIDHPVLDDVATRLAPIIAAADNVLVEATKDDQLALQRAVSTNPDLAFLSGPTLIDLLPPDDWKRLAEAAQSRGLPPFMAAKFQPWYLSLMLSMPPCVMQAVARGEHGLDHRIMDIAETANVPLAGLEPFDTIFTLFNQDPLEEQIEMLKLGMLSVEASENGTATLIRQYIEQEHVEAKETSRIITRPHLDVPQDEFDVMFDDVMALMIDTRNTNWMPVINATKGESIVVAVGALHLGGELGILNLLQSDGYFLERQAF